MAHNKRDSSYIGYFLNGKQHGTRSKTVGGRKYDGEFDYGQLNGIAKCINSSKSIAEYSGCKDDKPNGFSLVY